MLKYSNSEKLKPEYSERYNIKKPALYVVFFDNMNTKISGFGITCTNKHKNALKTDLKLDAFMIFS